MRSIIFGLLLSGAWFGAASAQTVGGNYSVKGTNLDGSSYSGTAEISPSGDTCRMVWHTGSTARGICMLANRRSRRPTRWATPTGLLFTNCSRTAC